jgi:uncharacterized protein with ParB-like and HNH nuclease domain
MRCLVAREVRESGEPTPTGWNRTLREIRGDAKNLRGLLAGSKYSVDYYQREYKWQTKQVSELIDDLAGKFLESFEPGHDRTEVESYGHYFLGSIIVSDKSGRKFLIDGQQRITTLSLLMIYVHGLLADSEQKGQLAELIFSQKFGKRSFNLDVPERAVCMEALYTGEHFDDADQPESVRNILSRYNDLVESFPDALKDHVLPYFADWLIENVHLVEITAYSDEDAYTIFETMNDRGLSLTATEMLKGYLLANITDSALRDAASKLWKDRIDDLLKLAKEEDADAIKSWLRSQHADSIRDRKRGAKPQDFDLIGTEFHRWVRDNEKKLELNHSGEFFDFVQKDFEFYSRWYRELRRAGDQFTPGMEGVFYNARYNFTLQYPVLLAALHIADNENQILTKVRIVSAFIDILIARRVWNYRAVDYSTLQYAMFVVLKEIRALDGPAVADVLTKRLAEETETFSSNDRFRLHGTNGRQIQRMLARMTDYLEVRSGMASHYTEYVGVAGKQGYEVEHIWANHPDRFKAEFPHPADFQEYRNRLGGLLLLPKAFNASYQDDPYEEKRKYYLRENLLAQSLHEDCYEHNPGFLRFIQSEGLSFTAYSSFPKDALDERQRLYTALAQKIWDPARLKAEVTAV